METGCKESGEENLLRSIPYPSDHSHLNFLQTIPTTDYVGACGRHIHTSLLCSWQRDSHVFFRIAHTESRHEGKTAGEEETSSHSYFPCSMSN